MPLPVLDKTWQYDLNNHRVSSGTGLLDRKQLLVDIIDALLGFGTLPWTIIGSCGGGVAGFDAVNRWSGPSQIVYSSSLTTAHSWIVVRQAAIASHFEICIDCVGTTPTDGLNLSVWVSPVVGFGTANGGTNGSATVRPTATDEYALVGGTAAGGQWTTNNSTARDHVLHAWQSSDGKVTRVVVRDPSQTRWAFFARFEVPKNPVAAWTNPSIAGWNATTTALNYAQWNDIANLIGNNPGGGTMAFYETTEGCVTSMLGEQLATANDLTTEWEATPIGLFTTTATVRGRHGRVFDLYYVSTSLTDGTGVPATPPLRQFLVVGHHLFPWDGSVPDM